MRLFRRTDSSARVELVDEAPVPAIAEHRALLRVCAEALILQDVAESVVLGARARQHLGRLAPRAGPVVRRFFALRDELPTCADPDAERLRGAIDAILHSHAMVVTTALELLAYEWRSERLARQVDALDGLGAPAGWLDDIYAELLILTRDAERPTLRAEA